MEYIALGIEEHEIEDHFAANNRFYKESGMTLNDLDFYAGSFGPIVSAVVMASLGEMAMEQAHAAMDKAISEYKALNDALDAELDAENEEIAA
jgi:hypothetical protein